MFGGKCSKMFNYSFFRRKCSTKFNYSLVNIGTCAVLCFTSPEAFLGARFLKCSQPLVSYHALTVGRSFHNFHPHFAIDLHHPYSSQCWQQVRPQHPTEMKSKIINSYFFRRNCIGSMALQGKKVISKNQHIRSRV